MFITEMKNELNISQGVCLRNLYTPILGSDAIMLYQLLIDYHKFNMGSPSYYLFKDISRTLRIEEPQLMSELVKLESLGLIRKFEKTDGVHFIITINAPLTPNELIKNKAIVRHAKKQIGELIFERVIFSLKETMLDKSDFKEITKKYQDVFDLEEEKEEDVTNTLKISIPKFSNVDEAIKSLAPTQFIKYISGNQVTPVQLSLVQKLQNSGFASDSINHIIKYSYTKNNKIVSRHIEVIADDFVKKGILRSGSVEQELNSAFINSTSTEPENTYSKPKKVKKIITNDLSWKDIFDSLGGEL